MKIPNLTYKYPKTNSFAFVLCLVFIVYSIHAYWYKFLGFEDSFIFKVIKDLFIALTIGFTILISLIKVRTKAKKTFLVYFTFFIILFFISIFYKNNSIVVALMGLKNYLWNFFVVYLITLLKYEERLFIEKSIFSAIFISAILGVVLYISPIDSYLIRMGGTERNVSLIGNPSSMALIIIWLLFYDIIELKKVKLKKIFILLLSLYLTKSSTGYLILVLTIFYYLTFIKKKIVLGIFVSLIIFSLLLIFVPRLFLGVILLKDPSLLARFDIWGGLFSEAFYDNIYTGVGLGTAANLAGDEAGYPNVIGITDNSPLAIVYQIGIVFFIVYAFIIRYLLKRVKRSYIKVILFSFLIASFAGNVLELGYPVNEVLWCLVAIEILNNNQPISRKEHI